MSLPIKFPVHSTSPLPTRKQRKFSFGSKRKDRKKEIQQLTDDVEKLQINLEIAQRVGVFVVSERVYINAYRLFVILLLFRIIRACLSIYHSKLSVLLKP